MREPKFKIGDMFFNTQYLTGSSDARVNKFRTFFRIPSTAVVVEVRINTKGIFYVLKEYLKNDIEIESCTETVSEECLIKAHRNATSIIKETIEHLLISFQDLQREANKEKLSAVLHGE